MKKQKNKLKLNTPSSKKVPAKAVVSDEEQKPRMLKKPTYKSFKVHKIIKPTQPRLPSAYSLFRKTVSVLKNNQKLFAGITAIYVLLTLVLVRGFSSGIDLVEIKDSLPEIYNGQVGLVNTTLTLMGSLFTSGSGATTSEGGVYQSIILTIVSLATIWALRQATSGQKPRVRDAFYKGLYPLIPMILVLLVIGLQLVPMAIGGWLYSVVVVGGIAGTLVEKMLWIMLVFLLVLLSLYMISSSLFALYIVTLPDMTPMRALRSARQLARYRRWTILRKILYLPLVLFILAVVIMLPFIIIFPAIAAWVFLVLSLFGWIVALGYMYMLYRELLNE